MYWISTDTSFFFFFIISSEKTIHLEGKSIFFFTVFFSFFRKKSFVSFFESIFVFSFQRLIILLSFVFLLLIKDKSYVYFSSFFQSLTLSLSHTFLSILYDISLPPFCRRSREYADWGERISFSLHHCFHPPTISSIYLAKFVFFFLISRLKDFLLNEHSVWNS